MGLEREIELNKQTKMQIDASLNASKHILAQQIINGLGKEIKDTLRNPPQPTKREIRKLRWRKFLDKLFNIT